MRDSGRKAGRATNYLPGLAGHISTIAGLAANITKAGKRNSIQRTSSTPSYRSGPIGSVGGGTNNQNAARMAAYNRAKNSFFAGLGKQAGAANSAYRGAQGIYKKGIAGANTSYGKASGSALSQYNSSKSALASQRLSDIEGMQTDYANRGINNSSGIYQQSLKDYETGYGSRVKGATDSYNTGLAGAKSARDKAYASGKKNLSQAAARRSATLKTIESKKKNYPNY